MLTVHKHNLIVVISPKMSELGLLKSKKSEKYTISELNKARDSLHNHGTLHPDCQITKEDLQKISLGDQISRIKSINREKLLEDLSCLLNDKVREFERNEQEDKWKELMLQKLNGELNDKIAQLESANKQLADEKSRSDGLNKQLQEALLNLRASEEQLRLERDWLAQQVEIKSKEVLDTIREMIQSESKPQTK